MVLFSTLHFVILGLTSLFLWKSRVFEKNKFTWDKKGLTRLVWLLGTTPLRPFCKVNTFVAFLFQSYLHLFNTSFAFTFARQFFAKLSKISSWIWFKEYFKLAFFGHCNIEALIKSEIQKAFLRRNSITYVQISLSKKSILFFCQITDGNANSNEKTTKKTFFLYFSFLQSALYASSFRDYSYIH